MESRITAALSYEPSTQMYTISLIKGLDVDATYETGDTIASTQVFIDNDSSFYDWLTHTQQIDGILLTQELREDIELLFDHSQSYYSSNHSCIIL